MLLKFPCIKSIVTLVYSFNWHPLKTTCVRSSKYFIHYSLYHHASLILLLEINWAYGTHMCWKACISQIVQKMLKNFDISISLNYKAANMPWNMSWDHDKVSPTCYRWRYREESRPELLALLWFLSVWYLTMAWIHQSTPRNNVSYCSYLSTVCYSVLAASVVMPLYTTAKNPLVNGFLGLQYRSALVTLRCPYCCWAMFPL